MLVCGVLDYADDVILLALSDSFPTASPTRDDETGRVDSSVHMPSAGAMRNVLNLCDEFACEFLVQKSLNVW